MNLLSLIYLLLYFIYVIFGDHIFTKLILNKDITFPPKINEILKRSLFITYLALLASSMFFYTKNINHFFIAISLSLISLFSFIIIYNDKSEFYISGIITHLIMLIPLIWYFLFVNKFKKEKINKNNKINKNYLIFLIVFLSIYYFIQPELYNY